MKSYSWILILVLFLSGFSSCHSDAERYKDILREGSWYVYDIDYSYKLYDDFETPELFDFFHYLLDERNLLFLPGDELMFFKGGSMSIVRTASGSVTIITIAVIISGSAGTVIIWIYFLRGI